MRDSKRRRDVLIDWFFFFQAEDGIRDESVDRKSTRLNSSHTLMSYAVSLDRKSTRLNSSHTLISYAVFCLKKKAIDIASQERFQKLIVIIERHATVRLAAGFFFERVRHHPAAAIFPGAPPCN